MKNGKRPKLPRGLRWDPKGPHIFFSWRDKRGDQHQQSTRTADAAEALVFKLRFLREKDDAVAQRRAQSADQSRLALSKAAELYFEWKAATNSPGTIEREKRMFHQVEKFVGLGALAKPMILMNLFSRLSRRALPIDTHSTRWMRPQHLPSESSTTWRERRKRSTMLWELRQGKDLSRKRT
jgi:hypothetical protein